MLRKSLALLLAAIMTISLTLTGCTFSKMTKTEKKKESAVKIPTASSKAKEDYDSDSITPLMWKVTSDKGGVLYLFGTIHVGDVRNELALDKVKNKIDECDSLAVEFDVVSYQKDTKAQMKDLQQFIYTDGTKITDHISSKLYEGLKKLAEDAGVYNSAFDYYNTALWTQIASTSLIQLSELNTDSAMDTQLINYAAGKDKSVIELESASFQYGLTNSFSEELNILMLQDALDSKDEYNEKIKQLYESWLGGDDEKLIELLNEQSGTDYTAQEQELIDDYNKKMYDDRNDGMAKKAKAMLDEGKKVFLAVGEAHMLGDSGIVKQLTDAGYKIEKIDV